MKVIEENDADEKNRPLWKQLMVALERGDELVISKFSNAIRGARELAMFLEFCRVKVIRVISIHDRIDSKNELFPETKPSDVLMMIGSLPDEALVHQRRVAYLHARGDDEIGAFHAAAQLHGCGGIGVDGAVLQARHAHQLRVVANAYILDTAAVEDTNIVAYNDFVKIIYPATFS